MSGETIPLETYIALQQRYQELQDELDLKISGFTETENFLEKRVTKLTKEVKDYQSTIATLEKQTNTLKDVLKEEIKNNKELLKNESTMNKNDEVFKNRIRELEITNDQLESQVRSLSDNVDDLTKQRDEYVDRLADQTTMFQQLEEEHCIALEKAKCNSRKPNSCNISHMETMTDTCAENGNQFNGNKSVKNAVSAKPSLAPSTSDSADSTTVKTYQIIRELLDIIEVALKTLFDK